jgi:hypothetical protein
MKIINVNTALLEGAKKNCENVVGLEYQLLEPLRSDK